MKIAILIFMFFCIGAFFIISQNNLALSSPEGVEIFISLYKIWLDKNFQNMGSLTSHVIKMDWLPK
jgi:hypothetical protein